MIIKLEPIVLKEEVALFYSIPEETEEYGCIGHLRGDFGRDGDEFHTTWFEHKCDELNDERFRDTFDIVINELRTEDGPLFNQRKMFEYCRYENDCKLPGGMYNTWGFRIFTQSNVLYLRCMPGAVGDYQFYCYAFDTEKLMTKLAQNRGLPRYCYGYLPTEQMEIRIDFGEMGYCPYRKMASDRSAKEMNRELGVTPAQAEAMKVGSMFGWNCPGADPKNYDGNGKLLPPSKSRKEERQ